MGLVPVLDQNKMFVTDKNGVTRKANRFEISRRENQLFHQCMWLTLEKSVEEFVSLEEAQDKYTEAAGELYRHTKSSTPESESGSGSHEGPIC